VSPLRGVDKGNKFARLVAVLFGTECRTLSGNKDRGDLVHPYWTVEVKAPGRGKPLNLSAAMTEAKVEAKNAGTALYCAVVRRTGYPTAKAFFVMDLDMALDVVPGLRVRYEGAA
jgi:hypothetical protein